MQEKTTNYEISKQLHELGFDCPTHCGWWHLCEDDTLQWYTNKNDFFLLKNGKENLIVVKWFKAYDCYDLLMFLQNCDEIKEENDKSLKSLHFNKMFVVWDKYVSRIGDTEPQNALGKGCIKILQEQKIKQQYENLLEEARTKAAEAIFNAN